MAKKKKTMANKEWVKDGYKYKCGIYTIVQCCLLRSSSAFKFSLHFNNKFGHRVIVTTKTGLEKDLKELQQYADSISHLQE